MPLPKSRTKKAPSCPECKEELRGVDPTPNVMVVCPRCAGISICDPTALVFRLLFTEEWWPVRARPEWYDLCERRVAVLESITAPATPANGAGG